MRTTLRHIAEETGLTYQTVGHVLNPNSPRSHLYSDSTKHLVIQVAKRMGYRPNAAARAVNRGRHDCIGLLLSKTSISSRSSLPYGLLDGIERTLAEADCTLSIGQLPDESLVENGLVPRLLRQWSVDGLLINRQENIPQAMIDLIAADPSPSVWINSKQKNSAVYVDDFAGGKAAAQYLLSQGHRKIAYVDYSHGSNESHEVHYSSFDRAEGYKVAMQEAGATPRIICPPEVKVPLSERPAFSRTWINKTDRPSAIIAYGESTCQPIYLEAARLGMAIPRDLSIVTFGEFSQSNMGVDFCTMVVPNRDMGEQAALMLLKSIRQKQNSDSQALGVKMIAFTLHEGQTVTSPSTES
jgi:LacI family transcriptional regulator